MATALAAVVVAIAALFGYLATLHPGLPAGDSGELITVAATSGVAHPPGYPLFAMLGGLWLRCVPLSSVALRLNLFSAVCMAAAAALLCLAVVRAGGSRVAGAVAGLAFAFAAPVWRYAIVAEVFALNALLASMVLWFVARPAAPAAKHRASVGGFDGWTLPVLAGLSTVALSHHHTLLLLLMPALIVAAVVRLRRPGAARAVAIAIGTALAGALPLLWIPFASARSGAQSWGEGTTLSGFLALLGRVDYGSLRLDPHQSGMSADRSHVAIFLESLPGDFGWLPLALAVAGVIVLARRRDGLAATIAGFVVLQAVFFTRVGFPSNVAWLHGVVERFYILPILVFAFMAGLGVTWLGAAWLRGRSATFAGLAVVAFVFVIPVLTHGRALSQRGNALPETLGRAILASLPRDAVLFSQGDLIHNSLAYLTRVEGLRPDVVVLDQELMTYGWYVRRVRRLHPNLLPASLAIAERIRLRDGRVGEGVAIPRGDGTTDVLFESEMGTVPSADVVGVTPSPPESLYAATRASFRSDPLLEQGDERYSGLPGSRNLRWLDHLAGRRPVAFLGTKDQSWSLRWELVPMGAVTIARPRGGAMPLAEQAQVALAVLDTVSIDAYFRPYEATSFEAIEKERLARLASRAAIAMCQPEAESARRAHPRGHARLLAFARRFEVLDPTPNADCLRAVGFLHLFDTEFADPAAARRALERYRATSAEAAKDPEVTAALASLGAAPYSGAPHTRP